MTNGASRLNLALTASGAVINLAFAVHRSTDDPNEFWLYETWESLEAVEAHESGPAFQQYKEKLRPIVEGDSVIFGNTTPIAELGYDV